MNTKSATLLLILSFIILIFASCKDDYEKLLKEIPINKNFATNSPEAKDISLTILNKPNKWGNMLLTANLKGQLQETYLAYEVDSQKVVLRDDGKGADSTKGDGIFSVFVKIDTNEIRDMVNEQNASVLRSRELEEKVKDIKNIISFIKFDPRDSTRSESSHKLLLNDGNFEFSNRTVKFNRNAPAIIETSRLFKPGVPIRLFPTFLCPAPPADLIPKSLMIRDISVVEDGSRTWNPVTHTGNRNGAWTFNNIINHMVNKTTTSVSATQFVLSWLQSWETDISFNGDIAPARPSITNLINNWKQRSLANGLPVDSLDMAEAPLKLLAIVNRVDLRQNAGYSSTNAGEGRFVFCVLSSTATSVSNSPLSFTVIFEYGVNKKGCDVKNWGQLWYNLHTLTLGDATYNTNLQAITDQFVNANTSPAKPNGSSLNQIRTDEIALDGPWQLREFNIDGTTHVPKLVTVKQTPRNPVNNTPFLASYIDANCAAIASNSYVIPETFSGLPILGIKSDNNFATTEAWNAPLVTCVTPGARQIFSINTCNACHGIETQTFFTHVNPASFGSMAGLSNFLTGETISDPISHTPVVIADLDDRARKLQSLVCSSCKIFGPLIFKPLHMVH